METRSYRIGKTLTLAACAMFLGRAFEGGCLDSAIALRFREASAPGLVSGFSSAITDPTNAEAGLRQAGAAVIEGLGAILEPRTGSGSNSGASNGSGA